LGLSNWESSVSFACRRGRGNGRKDEGARGQKDERIKCIRELKSKDVDLWGGCKESLKVKSESGRIKGPYGPLTSWKAHRGHK